jgi:hypothetical protein
MASITGHLFALAGITQGIRRTISELLGEGGAQVSLANQDREVVQLSPKGLTDNGVATYYGAVDR